MPENVGVDELIADQLGAGEGMVSKAEEGVGRISCSASSHITIPPHYTVF